MISTVSELLQTAETHPGVLVHDTPPIKRIDVTSVPAEMLPSKQLKLMNTLKWFVSKLGVVNVISIWKEGEV